jgi:hypothetical protein
VADFVYIGFFAVLAVNGVVLVLAIAHAINRPDYEKKAPAGSRRGEGRGIPSRFGTS